MSCGRCAISAASRFISLGCRRASFSGSTDEGMNPSRHLVIFLRAPRLGRVKSRLAAGIGALAALRFYRLATARLLRRVARDRRWRCHVWITPDRAARRPPWRAAAIRPAHIAASFRALGDHQAVFGPAADGGYWLVGLRRRPCLPRRLFERVRWSSEHALADTLAGLPKGLSVAWLETLEDVDDARAHARWRVSGC